MAKLPCLEALYIKNLNENVLNYIESLFVTKKNIKWLKLSSFEGGKYHLTKIPDFICNYDSLERLYIFSDSFKIIDKNIMKMKSIKRIYIATSYNGEVKIYKNISKTKTLELLQIDDGEALVLRNKSINPIYHPIYNKFPFNVKGKNKFHFFLNYKSYNYVPKGVIAFFMAFDAFYPLDSSYYNPQINCFNRKSLKMGMLKDSLLHTLELINVNKYFSLLDLNKNKYTNEINLYSCRSNDYWVEKDTFMEKYSLKYNDIKNFLIDIGKLKYIKSIYTMNINTIDTIPFEYFSNLNHINKFNITLNMLECSQNDIDKLKIILPNARIYMQIRGADNKKYNTIQISR